MVQVLRKRIYLYRFKKRKDDATKYSRTSTVLLTQLFTIQNQPSAVEKKDGHIISPSICIRPICKTATFPGMYADEYFHQS